MMKNLWKDKDAKKAIKQYKDVSEDVALRVYTSRLIGAEPKLVLHGGGREAAGISILWNRRVCRG
jgi:rhamnose utilization protein RhaD (predicted bifunctional aldolase and dehydrogenase)